MVRELERVRFTENMKFRIAENDLLKLRELSDAVGVSTATLIRWACRDLLERASNNPLDSLLRSTKDC